MALAVEVDLDTVTLLLEGAVVEMVTLQEAPADIVLDGLVAALAVPHLLVDTRHVQLLLKVLLQAVYPSVVITTSLAWYSQIFRGQQVMPVCPIQEVVAILLVTLVQAIAALP